MLLVLLIRKEEGRLTSFKDGLKFVCSSCFLWGISYVAMWITKWMLSSIILNINAMEYVKDSFMHRVNGLQGLSSKKDMYIGAIYRNFHNLYPINIEKRNGDLIFEIALVLTFICIFTDWKNLKKKWFAGLMLLIGIIPYLRYIILANHSFNHSIFTFRSQIVTCIALITAVLEVLNYKLLFKQIKMKK